MNKKTKITRFRPMIRSRNHTCSELRRRGVLPLLPFRSVVRIGSITELDDVISKGGSRIECNTVEAVKNSSHKIKSKKMFMEAGVPTPEMYLRKGDHLEEIVLKNGIFTLNSIDRSKMNSEFFPILAKRKLGSKARGMEKLDNMEQFDDFLKNRYNNNYYFEKYYNYAREYRLHVTEEGCFYTCRKMRKRDQEIRWYFNNDNCAWMVETNPNFNKPGSWNQIVESCVKALKAVGLDFGACDVRVSKDGHSYKIIEINSGPSFGTITTQKYIEEIPKILKRKHSKLC